MPKISKFVLTGGPCAGKTTSLERIKDILRSRGYYVMTIPEAATVAISNGIVYDPELMQEFQKSITTIQMQNERVFFNFAQQVADTKNRDVVVLMDRGLIDGNVYITNKEFEDLLAQLKFPPSKELYKRYDAVLFLDSAAIGAEEFYEMTEVRKESPEIAADLNTRTREVWEDHTNFVQFENKNKSFEKKLREVVDCVCNFLEIPVTMKTPKKFIIDFDVKSLPKGVKITKWSIEKFFLKSNNSLISNQDNRDEKEYSFARKQTSGRSCTYVLKTVTIENGQQVEKKQHFDARQFVACGAFADPSRFYIKQTRYLFAYDNVKYEVCIYDNEEINNLTILSVFPPFTSDFKDSWELPPFLKNTKEVTNDFKYTSHYLSLKEKDRPYLFSDLQVKNVNCRLVHGVPDYE